MNYNNIGSKWRRALEERTETAGTGSDNQRAVIPFVNRKDFKMINSAGINFGKPNEEFIIESDGNGAITSARNAVTGDEYVGGGGGDFSIAVITVNGASGLIIKGAFTVEGSAMGDLSNGNNTSATGNNLILYKGKGMIEVNQPASMSGSIEHLSGNFYIVSGDCTLNY